MQHNKPLISEHQRFPEITLKAVLLAIILVLLLAAANAYLALKIGILTSASIPAAIISMGILKLFKKANVLENNLVQTAASAGEAVAGGIVYTIPALIIIHYWSHFAYWENLAIALAGGLLGVFFSIPLRKLLVTDRSLHFPEGRAIAEVLQMEGKSSLGLNEILWGGALGAGLELAQSGFKLLASQIQLWFIRGKVLVGFGMGFSATLLGAGYLIGFRTGVSLLIGAILGWYIGIPLASFYLPSAIPNGPVNAQVMALWDTQLRYLGIGAMLMAAIWTLLHLCSPFYASIMASYRIWQAKPSLITLSPSERDIPPVWVGLGISCILLALYPLLHYSFNLEGLGIASGYQLLFLISCILYILLMGFAISAICGYFSGMVGVTATPGSAIVLLVFISAALLLRFIFSLDDANSQHLLQAAAVVIILGAIITGAACIANDNIQDLKVGYILGATPWKQQLMLLLGVVIAAAVIPPVMELLFNVYGIAGVFPHPGMDPSQVLAAPPAAMFAAVTQAVFHHDLPWGMLLKGAALILCLIGVNSFFLKPHGLNLSILGIATGIYLPLASSIPLFLGSLMAFIANRYLERNRQHLSGEQLGIKRQKGLLLACGLVSGAALMNIILAIPFAVTGNPDLLRLLPVRYESIATSLSVIYLILLGFGFMRLIRAECF